MSIESLVRTGIETYERCSRDTTDYCDDPGVYRREDEARRDRSRREVEEYWRQHPERVIASYVAAERSRKLEASAALHALSDRMRTAEAKTIGEFLALTRPSLFFSTSSEREVHDGATQTVMNARAAAYTIGERLTSRSTLKDVFDAARVALRSLP